MTLQSQSGIGGLPQNAQLDMVINFVNRLMIGRLNAFQDLTLTANATSTTISDPRIGATTAILAMPVTANAATELGNGTLYIPTATMKKGSAVIQHANNAQTDRTFRFLLIG